jgi:hypothetical protein
VHEMPEASSGAELLMSSKLEALKAAASSAAATVRALVKEAPKRFVKVRVPVPEETRTAEPLEVAMGVGLYVN